MNPTDDHGVHTHDFRETLGRCICGELVTYDPKHPERGGMLDREEYAGLYEAAEALRDGPSVLNIAVPETDWKAYAADQLSGDPARLLQHLPEWMRNAEVVNMHVATAPDMETRAEIWNEGFDTAHKQGVGGELSYGWLLNKLAPILDELAIPREQIDDVITRIADQILDDSLLHDADSDPRTDQQRGMYGKYFVERLHDPEGKHEDCRFFVLDPVHDQYALTALKSYAMASRDEFPKLAEDLRGWIGDVENGWE
jgi:hypothetical protein